MAASFGAAVDATTPAIVDTNSSQGTGAVSAGIGLVPADAADIAASRIGTGVTDEILGEVGDGVGV